MIRIGLLFAVLLGSALSAQGGENERLNLMNGTFVEGSGSAFMTGPDGSVLTLTGGALTSRTNDSVTINGKTFRVTATTRICANTGRRIPLKAIPPGEKVLVVSLAARRTEEKMVVASPAEESNAQTIRVGPMLSKLTESGDLERVNNYACK